MPNPFALKKALADLDAKGIVLGDIVRVEWDVPPEYGGGTRSHTGPLAELDRKRGRLEINPSSNSPGHLRTSLVGAKIEKVEESGTIDSSVATNSNPFVAKASKEQNPFLAKSSAEGGMD